MQTVNFRSFKQKLRFHKKSLNKFLNRLLIDQPRGLDLLTLKLEKEVWKEADCLSCANCCKTMSPTYTKSDINRISKHFSQTPKEFTKQWLHKDRAGDVLNKSLPCQFLNSKDNKCSIYAIRPADCSGFPHLHKKRMVDYMHVYKQNLEYCPATYKLVEKMQQAVIVENKKLKIIGIAEF